MHNQAQIFSKRNSQSFLKDTNPSQHTSQVPLNSQHLSYYHPFPVELTRIYQLSTAYPVNANWIMSTLPQPVPENYYFTISYDMGRALYLLPHSGVLRIGFLGAAGTANWTVTYLCSNNVTHHHPHPHIHRNHAYSHMRHHRHLHTLSYRDSKTRKPSHSYSAVKKCQVQ